MESAESIVELYREHTQRSEPSAFADRSRGAPALFGTHALVVALADGTTRQREHLANHRIERAAGAIAAALDGIS